MGLPFGYAKCSRGDGGQAPRCPEWWNIQNPEPPRPSPAEQAAAAQAAASRTMFGMLGQPVAQVARPLMSTPAPQHLGLASSFGHYLPILADGVHSGSGRTALADNNTDYYPVSLKQETLRPGTVYADPYGHILMIAARLPQSGSTAGVLLAVDAQPDGTVARKRFWRGNFLTPRSEAPGSSASGRSCATRAAPCGGSPTMRSRKIPTTAIFRSISRTSGSERKSVADVKAELEGVLASELSARKFSYPRSDGSAWALTLKEASDRAADLEMAYNVNDCVELRWGAPDNTAETSTCKRHAPRAQRAKMAEYRAWFHERRRPPRAEVAQPAAATTVSRPGSPGPAAPRHARLM
jgi:hypothetical protein